MTKKNAYEVNAKGNIISYNINWHTERFSFLSKESSMYEKMLGKVNSLLNGMVAEKEYTIDWKMVVDEYMERGIGDVPHFANQYVLTRYVINADLRKKMSKEGRKFVSPKKEILEAIYLEIVSAVNGEIDKGNLPGSIEDLNRNK